MLGNEIPLIQPDGHKPSGFCIESPPSATPAWRNEEHAGWYGGLCGGMIGFLGTVLGVMVGLGLARRFVLYLYVFTLGSGIVLLCTGSVAVLMGQPYHVYYPLLLIGGISSVVFGFNRPVVKRRYDQIELRKMTALDT